MTEAPSDQLGLIHALARDPKLQSLSDYRPAFNLVAALGQARSELAHSGVLAALLDPCVHRSGDAILRELVRDLGEHEDLEEVPRRRVRDVLEDKRWSVTVERERYRIDVLVNIHCPSGDLVLGIENKIDAGEQDRQLERYQSTLLTCFPNHAVRLLVYLSPDGRAPKTASRDLDVPCLVMGYEWLAGLLEGLLEGESIDKRDRAGIRAFLEHVSEELVGTKTVKTLAREIWRDHAQALRLLYRHQPELEDIKDAYCEGIKSKLGDGAKLLLYPPQRGALSEIKLELKSWTERGIPLTFMLFGRPGQAAQLRVVVYRDAYKTHEATLRRWATTAQVAEGAGFRLDPKFRPISGWGVWRRVFAEEYEPASSFFGGGSYNEKTASEALRRLFEQIDLLRSSVESMPRSGAK